MPLRRPTFLPTAILLSGITSLSDATSSRFHKWFSSSADIFANVSSQTCNATLRAFDTAYDRHSDHAWIDLGIKVNRPIFQLCKDQMNCILGNVSEAEKASLATSGVVLGLLPTLLAVLSPSIAELALLSSQRPLLAFFLSFGALGVLQTRIFEYEDPAELLDPPEGSRKNVRAQLVLGPWTDGMSKLVAFAEFLLALACCVNTGALAIQLSYRSIISWGCTRTWPTIVWVFVPIVIHGFAAVGYRLTLEKRPSNKQSSSEPTQEVHTSSNLPAPGYIELKELSTQVTPARDPVSNGVEPQRAYGGIIRWFQSEWTSCASHLGVLRLRLPRDKLTTRANIGILLTCIAGFLSFFHLVYGTVAFSALLFIDPLDSIGTVSIRLLVSSTFCRFIVLVELAGIRGGMWRNRLASDQ